MRGKHVHHDFMGENSDWGRFLRPWAEDGWMFGGGWLLSFLGVVCLCFVLEIMGSSNTMNGREGIMLCVCGVDWRQYYSEKGHFKGYGFFFNETKTQNWVGWLF